MSTPADRDHTPAAGPAGAGKAPAADRPAADAAPAADPTPAAGAGADPTAASDAGPAGERPAPDAVMVGAGGTSRREHAVRGTLAAALSLEALTVLFVPQTVAGLSDDGLGGVQLGLLLGLAAALIAAAAIQRFRVGLVLGSVLQLAVIATGVLVGAMYFLGLLFAGVWAYLLWIREQILRAGPHEDGTPG